MRSVITGMTPAGKSVFVKDGAVESFTSALVPGVEWYEVWGDDAVPRLPADGTEPESKTYFPPAPGFRFGFFTIPPANTPPPPAGLDVAAAVAELNAKLPGLLDVQEADNPGMHRTDTIDYIVVMSGEISLELDDGKTVQLHPGDCVVQNGTRHAWRNTSNAPCLMAYALVGARRA